MKENVRFLLSWINDPSKKVFCLDSRKGQSFLSIPARGLTVQNGDSWLSSDGEVVSIEGELVYMDGREYLEGPSKDDLFNKVPVYGVIDRDDKLVLIAPQFSHVWEVFCFKRNLKKILSKERYEKSAALVDFLYRNKGAEIKKIF